MSGKVSGKVSGKGIQMSINRLSPTTVVIINLLDTGRRLTTSGLVKGVYRRREVWDKIL